ncbi:lactate utilization protein [Paraflavisolibacter sp. H34]|uniref:LutC/YkgG family protein n=1 Tax=Huijunlia imazamoxiresistens TaxID=3127457 RepID=UPI00301A250D
MSGSARDNILKKIRMALEHPTPLPFPDSEGGEPVFQPLREDLEVAFAEQFTHLQGKFIFCLNRVELLQQFARLCYQNHWSRVYCAEEALRQELQLHKVYTDIATCEVAVTTCEALVARTGSILLSSAQNGRLPSVYAPIHVCVAWASQLVYDIPEALERVRQRYHPSFPSLVTLASGPSRTADIEKTLVVGVHGPKEVYCLVVEEEAVPAAAPVSPE